MLGPVKDALGYLTEEGMGDLVIACGDLGCAPNHVSLDSFLGKTYDTPSPKSNSDIAWGKAQDRFIYLSRMIREVQKRRFVEGLQLDRVAKGNFNRQSILPVSPEFLRERSGRCYHYRT